MLPRPETSRGSAARWWRQAVSVLILLVALAVPRLLELDRFVTPDEHKWLTRSGNFYLALLEGELANTYQREHPGVTIMWAGTAALLARCPAYARNAGAQLDVGEYLRVLRASGCDQLDILATSRLILILGHVAILLLAFVHAQRLFGLTPALAGSLLLAFDPFHVGHSRVFHLDGLLSSLVLLSFLAFLAYRQDRRPRTMAVSFVAFGLACLVKSTSAFLIPVIGLIAGWDATAVWRTGSDSRLRAVGRALWPAIAWGIGGLLTILLLWPAMWVDPIGTPARVIESALNYAQEGHGGAVFFEGEIAEDGNLGADIWRFYPITYAWRSTPIALLGLVAAAILLVWRRGPLAQATGRHAVVSLLLFVVVFAFLMNLGAKKFDRYVVAVYPALDYVAGVGLVGLVGWIAASPRFAVSRRYIAPTLLVVPFLLQAAGTLATFPYYLSYYNPLLGGSHQAPQTMMIGWGEGLNLAAEYLNAKPDAQNLRVATWYPRCFSCFFSGVTRRIAIRTELNDDEMKTVLGSDYVVIYIHQWQRRTPANLLALLEPLKPEHSVWINGLEYARIYALRDLYETP